MRFVKNEMYLISTCRCDGYTPLCIVTGVTDVTAPVIESVCICGI